MHFVKCKFLLILYLGGCEFDLFGLVKVIFDVKNYDLFRIFSFLFYHVVNLLALSNQSWKCFTVAPCDFHLELLCYPLMIFYAVVCKRLSPFDFF